MKVTRKSAITGSINTMDLPVTQKQLDDYREHVDLVQNIFPTLSPDEREFLISGITPAEWAKFIGIEDQ